MGKCVEGVKIKMTNRVLLNRFGSSQNQGEKGGARNVAYKWCEISKKLKLSTQI